MNTQRRNYRSSWLKSLVLVKLTPAGVRLTGHQADTSLGEDISSAKDSEFDCLGFFITWGFSYYFYKFM